MTMITGNKTENERNRNLSASWIAEHEYGKLVYHSIKINLDNCTSINKIQLVPSQYKSTTFSKYLSNDVIGNSTLVSQLLDRLSY